MGEIYGIKSSIDGSFNRGSVEEILSDNHYSVVLLDLGTRDIVSDGSFVEISEQLKQVIFNHHCDDNIYKRFEFV